MKRYCRDCGKLKGPDAFWREARTCRKCVAKRSGRERTRRAKHERAEIRQRFGLRVGMSGRRLQVEVQKAVAAAEGATPWTRYFALTTLLYVMGHLVALGLAILGLLLVLRFTWLSAALAVVLCLCAVGLLGYLEGRSTPRAIAVGELTDALLREGVLLAEREQLEYARFYATSEWRAMRRRILRRDGTTCARCGAVPRRRDVTVDHILPRSKRPDLALDPRNLRVLCRSCNASKGARGEQ